MPTNGNEELAYALPSEFVGWCYKRGLKRSDISIVSCIQTPAGFVIEFRESGAGLTLHTVIWNQETKAFTQAHN